MGSGEWFKTIISRKKAKVDKLKKTKVSTPEQTKKPKATKHNDDVTSVLTEDLAATRIQTAFRAHQARKVLYSLKGMGRLQTLIQTQSCKNQSSMTLGYIQMWTRIQSQISTRRLHMVSEGRIKQKKLDIQLRVEAKLQDLQVEWNGGPETMEETIARIQQREEAAMKRERAMAYAFSHQWRANSGQNFAYEFGDGNWGWSWIDRWIAARPWESRISMRGTKSISPKKPETKLKDSKNDKKSPKIPASLIMPTASNGKQPVRRLSHPIKVERIITNDTTTEASASLDHSVSNSNGGPQRIQVTD